VTDVGDLALEPGVGNTVQLLGPVVASTTLLLGDDRTDVGATLASMSTSVGTHGTDIESLWTAFNVSACSGFR
jgi:hypothetical protein